MSCRRADFASNEFQHTRSNRTHTQNYCKYHTRSRGAIFGCKILQNSNNCGAGKLGVVECGARIPRRKNLRKATPIGPFWGEIYSVNLWILQASIIGRATRL